MAIRFRGEQVQYRFEIDVDEHLRTLFINCYKSRASAPMAKCYTKGNVNTEALLTGRRELFFDLDGQDITELSEEIRWLRAKEVPFNYVLEDAPFADGAFLIDILDKDKALLFKLTFGGVV